MINFAMIEGRLTKDPEGFTTTNGKQGYRFTIANNQKDYVNYFECVYWDAENIIQWFKKGTHVTVRGPIKKNKWQDKNGSNRITDVITVQGFDFMSSGKKKDSSEQPAQTQPSSADEYNSEDNIPF